MTGIIWTVRVKTKMRKNIQKLPPPVALKFGALLRILQDTGPTGPHIWQHYSKLGANKYHCHLGYHYAACWTAENETLTIEVYYVGSRESAPY